MPLQFNDITPQAILSGVIPGANVTVIALQILTPTTARLDYEMPNGTTAKKLIYDHSLADLRIVQDVRPWTFRGDGAKFRLASEAVRIRLAHIFDPLLAIHTSLLDPLPHQITAVYESLLPRQPLRFLLADDPGAGKTIMAGLYIKELISRGDLERCLIVCPGSLAEQWQDELYQRFGLEFSIMTNDGLESARTGNWFSENDLVIARLDKLSRNQDVQQKLKAPNAAWDLIICDEAHKMSATFSGKEAKFTKRYRLGELLGSLTRHFLLMTATPHNGKEEDFQLFLALLDNDRFEGRFREGVPKVDVSDIMRRMVKEKLLKFDGTPLFPERIAYTVNYDLSEGETSLYERVTKYVRDEFNRADKLDNDKRKGTVGFALTILQRRLASSPEAIYQSIRRRRDRLEKRIKEMEEERRRIIITNAVPAGAELMLEDYEELEDVPESEAEEIQGEILDQATAARTIDELKAEIATLEELEQLAAQVRNAGVDKKWQEMSSLLTWLFGSKNPDTVNEPRVAYHVHPIRRPAPSPKEKIVVFTEHRDTLRYLEQRMTTLLGKSDSIRVIHGSMGRQERLQAQEDFKNDPNIRILLATDAAGEGINLQRAHVMVNYDLPWNPNRIEQRFGRIHRIGQTEICYLWNLVAKNTREGDVFQTLLDKLEEARNALGGQVFDVLGRLLFDGKPLRELLIEAIRYGEREDVRARLTQVVENAVDQDQIRTLLEEKALVQEIMDNTQVQRIREDMERAEARRLQPFYIEAFFLEALKQLGGSVYQREPRRYEIKNVPAEVRNRSVSIVARKAIARQYERIAFEKSLLKLDQKPPASFICPGHPLLDAVLDLSLEKNQEVLKQGTILVDDADLGTQPRVIFYIEHAICDSQRNARSVQNTISQRMLYVQMDPSGAMRHINYAPYLDYRPLSETEPDIATLLDRQELAWVTNSMVEKVVNYAAEKISRQHLEEVRGRRLPLIQKTKEAVKIRLQAEINFWGRRALELKLQEDAGKPNARLNSQQARKQADELYARLNKRLVELDIQADISSLPPNIKGGFIVVPKGLLMLIQGNVPGPEKKEESDPYAVGDLARNIVMRTEKDLGFTPVDREAEKVGYDVESIDPATGHLRFIEVKGRSAKADFITVTANEIITALNKPEDFILALVLFTDPEDYQVRYIRCPFQREPDFGVTSVNYKIKELLARSMPPQ